MEIAWSAVRPVRNRLLLGVFTFFHPLLVFSEAWPNCPIMFTNFLNKKNCSAVHSESSVGGGGLYILPSDSHAPLLLERLAMERQRLQVEGFGRWSFDDHRIKLTAWLSNLAMKMKSDCIDQVPCSGYVAGGWNIFTIRLQRWTWSHKNRKWSQQHQQHEAQTVFGKEEKDSCTNSQL